MRLDRLMGMTVIGTRAVVLGEVCEVEFDEKIMKITSIYVKLNENVIEPLGLKNPRFGSVKVDIPVEVIEAIGDVVNINKSVEELRSIVRRR